MNKRGLVNDVDNNTIDKISPFEWDFLFDYYGKKNKKIKILDLGCGTGNIMLSVYKNGYKNIIGLEFDKRMYKKTLEKFPFLKIVNGDAENMKMFKNNSFDLVYCSQVLEHLENPEKALKEINRILRKKGALIIGIPDGDHLNDILIRIIQRIYYGKYEHLQRFNEKKITDLLVKSNFKIKKIKKNKGTIDFFLDRRINKSFLMKKLTNLLFRIFQKFYYKNKNFAILAIKD